MACKNCKQEKCIGFYLLHPSELHKIETLKKKHSNESFQLINSPSSGETFVQFKELHVIEK